MPLLNPDACEMAYHNGYEKGYKDAVEEYGVKLWVGDPVDGDIYCPTCGTVGPYNLPKHYLRYCSYCGQRLTFQRGV